MIVGHLFILWITLGSLTIEKPPVQYLPTTVEECTNNTFSQIAPDDLSTALWNHYSSALQMSLPFNASDTDFVEDYKDQPNNDNLVDLEIMPTMKEM